MYVHNHIEHKYFTLKKKVKSTFFFSLSKGKYTCSISFRLIQLKTFYFIFYFLKQHFQHIGRLPIMHCLTVKALLRLFFIVV